MTTRKFKFIRTDRDVSRPMLAVTISNPKNKQTLPTYALVDSGAGICALPTRYAKILGFKLKKLKRRKLGTGGGQTKAYIAVCNISIHDAENECVKTATETGQAVGKTEMFDTANEVTVAFLPKLQDALIGVKGVLDRYIVEIDYLNEEFSLSKC